MTNALFDDPLDKYIVRRILIISQDIGALGRLSRFLIGMKGHFSDGRIEDASVSTLADANRYITSNQPNIVIIDPAVSSPQEFMTFVATVRDERPHIVWVIHADSKWRAANQELLQTHSFGVRLASYYWFQKDLPDAQAYDKFVVFLTLCHRDFVLALLSETADDIQADVPGTMSHRQIRKFVEKAITPLLQLLTKGESAPAPHSRLAFVSMRFSPQQQALYALAIRPALIAAGYTPIMMADEASPGPIPTSVFAHIASCQLFLADITDLRADVLIEVGAALIAKVPMIILRGIDLRDDQLPFMLRSYGVVTYASHLDLEAVIQRELGRFGV